MTTEDITNGAAGKQRVEALARGLRILALFSGSDPCLRLNQIAEKTGLPLATTHRLVATLQQGGYLERLPDNRLRPAPAVLTLGFAALQGQDLLQASSVALRSLADVTGQTVNLGVLEGDRVLYLARLRNTDLVTANVQVGSQIPAVYGSMGKVLLAALSGEQLRQRISKESFAGLRGPRAVDSLAELELQLHAVRAQGWAVQDEEVAAGLRSVAAPVRRGLGGEVVAAINLAVQASVWPLDLLLDKCLGPLLAACEQASRGLGYSVLENTHVRDGPTNNGKRNRKANS